MDILAETIKVFNGLIIQSTINDSAYYNSEEDDAESDPYRDSKLATHTSDGKKIKVSDTDTINRNSPQKLLINRTIPVIIPPIDPPILNGVMASRRTFRAHHMIALKYIVTDAARSGARVFQDHVAVNQKDKYGTIPRDGNTSRIPPRFIYPVWIGNGPSVPPNIIRSHEIEGPSRSIIT